MLEPLEIRLCLSVSLSPVFGDHMVLQRDMPIHVEGSALPGENVAVTLAGPAATETASTRAGSGGAWSVTLGALPAGGPYTLTAAGQNTVVLSDLLMGDVWVCSGQSNMVLPLINTDNGAAVASQANQAQLRLYSQDSGWADTTPSSAANFSAVAYYFGKDIQQEQGVPVGLMLAAWDGTSIRLWASWQTDVTTPALAPYLDDIAANAGTGSIPGAPPGYLYNTLIQPLTSLAIKGVVWYQGELDANAGRTDEYAVLFPALIASWRQAWNEGNFPFLYVQLPLFNPIWTTMQQVQLDTLSEVPNTAMAVIVDGQSDVLHPTDKQLPGDRLALAAEALAYGENVVASGPLVDGWTLNGNQAVLTFQDVGSGLVFSDGASNSFEVENAAGQWVAANAVIQNGTIVVWSDAVAAPTGVRYAYEANPVYDLFNADGLPASPFEVTAADMGPLVVPRQSQNVLQGSAGTVRLGSFTPPAGAVGPWSVQVNWGDGASTTLQYATLPAGGSLGTATHTYSAIGNYAVQVTVSDDNGDVLGQNVLTVSVLSPAPLLVDRNGDLFADFSGEGVWGLPKGATVWQPLTAPGVEDATLLAIDGNGDLFVEFPGYGVWRLPKGEAAWQWQRLTGPGVDASLLTVDGNGDLFAEFHGQGVWELPNGATVWRRLTAPGAEDATLLVADGSGHLFADFPGQGVDEYVSATTWQSVHPARIAGDASLLATDGAGDQFADFPGQGVWELPRGTMVWQQLTAPGVEDASLLATDGAGDLFAAFPGEGVWGLSKGATVWQQLTTPGVQGASLLAADGAGDLFAEFSGYGVWELPKGDTAWQWQRLTAPGGEDASLLAVDANGDLFAEFPGEGVWGMTAWHWQRLTAVGDDASVLAVDGNGDLFTDFHGQGVWELSKGGTVWQQLTAAGVEDASLLVADDNGDLFADFPGYGVWRLPQGQSAWQWQRLTPGAEVASLLTVDGNGDLFTDFPGYGIDEYISATGWQSVRPARVAADATLLAADGAGDLFADFPGYGVWRLPRGATVWQQLPAPGDEDASLLAVDGAGNLFAEFPGQGVDEYVSATDWQSAGSVATLPG